MSDKFPVDVKKFAEMFDVEESTAYGVLRFLAEKGIVETTKRPQPQGKKGKPATIFLVDVRSVCAQLGSLLTDKFEQFKPMLLAAAAAAAANNANAVVVEAAASPPAA